MTFSTEAALEGLMQYLGCTLEQARDSASLIDRAVAEVRKLQSFPAGKARKEARQFERRRVTLDLAAGILLSNKKIGEVEIYGHEGGPSLSDIECTVRTLKQVAGVFQEAADQKLLRRCYGLPQAPRGRNRLSATTDSLWWPLGAIWTTYRGMPARSAKETGAFFLFVKFVHDRAELDSPIADTLKSAADRWWRKDAMFVRRLRKLSELYGSPKAGGD